MMKARQFLILLTIFLVSGFTISHVKTWDINDDFVLRFTDRQANGVFENLTGTIMFDSIALPSAKFDVSINVSSINTGNKLKNKHAMGPKWFDAETFPVIHFQSDSIVRHDSIYQVTGTLAMKGVSQVIRIPFSFQEVGDSAVFEGEFKIDRTSFGIGKEKGDERDSTTLEIRVPVNRME